MNTDEGPKDDELSGNVVTISTSTRRSSDFWGRTEVMALISQVEDHFEDFYDDTKKKKAIWNAIGKRMQEAGHACTGQECHKKWRNLKITYIRVLQKQIHGETSSRFEYFDALHHIIGKEIDPLGMREQGLNQVEPGSPTGSTAPTEYDEITVDGEFVWSEAAVIRLLGLLRHRHTALTIPHDHLHPSWQLVAGDMNEGGYEATSEQCQRKWVNLLEGFHFHQAAAEATGSCSLWVFFTRVRELVNTTPIKRSPTSGDGRRRGRGRGRGRSGGGGKMRGRRVPEPGLATESGGGGGVLGRVRKLEMDVGLGRRMDHLEARVDEVSHHQESYEHTNSILARILSELRRINSVMVRESHQTVRTEANTDSIKSVEQEQAEQHDDDSCGSNQGIIIVEAYTDQT